MDFNFLCRECQRELYYLKRNFNKNMCSKTAFSLVEFCNNANYFPGSHYERLLSEFQYFWDHQLKWFFKEQKSEKMLQEELEICNNFLVFFEELLCDNNFVDQFGSNHSYSYSQKVWLILYAYLSYSKAPHSLKILFTMLYSSIYYTDDQLLNRLRKLDHFWIYKLNIYLLKDLIDEDFDLEQIIKEDIIDPLKEILIPGDKYLKTSLI